MKKIIALLSVFVFFVSSCSSDENPVETPQVANSGLLKKMIIITNNGDVNSTYEFTYNSNKLVKIVSPENYNYSLYTYTGDLITKYETFNETTDVLTSKVTYTYNSAGQMTSAILLDYEDEDGYKEVYTHNSNGTVTSNMYMGDLITQTDYISTETLIFSNGNLISEEFDTYTYDDKVNPFKNILGFTKLLLSYENNNFNNPLTVSGLTNETYTYTYNNMNLPVTSELTIGGNPFYTVQYFYY